VQKAKVDDCRLAWTRFCLKDRTTDPGEGTRSSSTEGIRRTLVATVLDLYVSYSVQIHAVHEMRRANRSPQGAGVISRQFVA
jgi:hypothetical protein